MSGYLSSDVDQNHVVGLLQVAESQSSTAAENAVVQYLGQYSTKAWHFQSFQNELSALALLL